MRLAPRACTTALWAQFAKLLRCCLSEGGAKGMKHLPNSTFHRPCCHAQEKTSNMHWNYQIFINGFQAKMLNKFPSIPVSQISHVATIAPALLLLNWTSTLCIFSRSCRTCQKRPEWELPWAPPSRSYPLSTGIQGEECNVCVCVPCVWSCCGVVSRHVQKVLRSDMDTEKMLSGNQSCHSPICHDTQLD